MHPMGATHDSSLLVNDVIPDDASLYSIEYVVVHF